MRCAIVPAALSQKGDPTLQPGEGMEAEHSTDQGLGHLRRLEGDDKALEQRKPCRGRVQKPAEDLTEGQSIL